MIKRIGWIAFVFAFSLTAYTPLAQAGSWEDGLKAFARKEYAAAAKLFRPLAEKVT